MKTRLFLFLLLTTFGLIGCTSDEEAIPSKQIEPTKELASEVKEVKVNEAPSDASSPTEAALNQYEVIFNNGESKFPTKEAPITETTLGNTSVLAIRSPEGKDNYAVFLYAFDKKWFIEGVIRIGFLKEEAYSNEAGLALPMNRFNMANIKIGEGKEVWAFADSDKIVTISRYDRFVFDDLSSSQEVSIKDGIKAFVGTDSFNNKFLYYFDSEKLITVSGNVSEEQLLKLANSLPSALSAHFPSATE